MGMRTSRSDQHRDSIDEYDLGERFKQWSRHATAQVVTYTFAHTKPLLLSAIGVFLFFGSWWMVVHHRPAEPPPPSAWRMQQMMRAVEEADRRIRTERSDQLGQEEEFHGVFETMRDIPVPLQTAESSGKRSQPMPESQP
jgi:hypothetical protein